MMDTTVNAPKRKRSRTYTDVVEWFPTRAQDREVEGKNIGNRVSI